VVVVPFDGGGTSYQGRTAVVVCVWRLVFGRFPRQLRSACIMKRISWPITGPVLYVHDSVFCPRCWAKEGYLGMFVFR
jgi:hypothetical protein